MGYRSMATLLYCTALIQKQQLTKSHTDKESNELISYRHPPQVLVFNNNTERESNYWALKQNQKYNIDHSKNYYCGNTVCNCLSGGSKLLHPADGHTIPWAFGTVHVINK